MRYKLCEQLGMVILKEIFLADTRSRQQFKVLVNPSKQQLVLCPKCLIEIAKKHIKCMYNSSRQLLQTDLN